MPGISGFSLYLPPYRVRLEDWCDWNNQPWDKVRNVVGRSFRMHGPDQSVYTMAANAVWRLMQAYDIDPQRVGYLALGTESASDNSAGAVIVRGMLDDALAAEGWSALARDCEVPEFKHACLGGMYALKGALRYLATDGANRQAIVICADIAEYARGSSGEPTQGAGAVAMLVEPDARLLTVDLATTGSASAYRLADFRKPFARYRDQPARADGQIQDLPVFNGRHSTNCYVEATCRAVESMVAQSGDSRSADEQLDAASAVFMHRPYHRMPQNGWGMARLAAMAAGADGRERLQALCADAELDATTLLAELTTMPDMRERLFDGEGGEEAYGTARKLLRHLRRTDFWRTWAADKLALGSDNMRDLGNLYTAALPAWLAAGLSQAAEDDMALAGQTWLALGYGSGDAAEAWPMHVVDGWEAAAGAIDFKAALATPVDLDEAQYVGLHDGRTVDLPMPEQAGCFVVDHYGRGDGSDFDDAGIEYHRYCHTG